MEGKKNLGKEQKIKNILIQRRFIENQLNKDPSVDGNPAYRYVGYLFPENKKYFDTIGVYVTSFNSEVTLNITGGIPIHIFTPICIEKLTDEELKESEGYANAKDEEELDLGECISSLFKREIDKISNCDIKETEEYIKAKEQMNGATEELERLMTLLMDDRK